MGVSNDGDSSFGTEGGVYNSHRKGGKYMSTHG